MPAIRCRFFLLGDERMSFGGSVLAEGGHLPGNFAARFPSGNLELVAGDFVGNIQVPSRRADGRKLIAEVPVLRLEPPWKLNGSRAAAIEQDVAAVDVHQFRRFDRSMDEVLVGWVEGVVNLEVLAAGGDECGCDDLAGTD